MGHFLWDEPYDALDVTGTAFLEGLLEVSLIDGFTPSLKDEFVILQANNIDGTFANAAQSIAVGNYFMSISYFEDRVVLGNATAIPEPATGLLLVLGAVAMMLVRGRP